ncbi:hypothetical protein [Streptomyces sp. NPDC127084]|uniref:hypothetical protein n=1 Tax=Streptomyces sp. NPDC127084 TaxID=3347133 RepID=UPI00364E7E22
MGSVEEREAAMALAKRAHEVGRVLDATPWQRILRALSAGPLGRTRRMWDVVTLATPWQDTPSPERPGWRERAANLHDEFAFSVDYTTCPHCRLGWVESPWPRSAPNTPA